MKKITSEISMSSPDFKIKWGTIDKKNPSFIYLEMGTYITPKKEEENYSNSIKEIEKSGKSIIKNAINLSSEVKKDFIFVTDIADTRINYGKQSYLTFQIHMGSKMDYLKDFKAVANHMNIEWQEVYNAMKNTIEENGFFCSKTKK